MTWPGEVRGFDAPRFMADVHAYRERHRLSRSELVRAAGFDLATGLRMLRADERRCLLSLSFVCTLADVCDLSLDAYRVNTWSVAV